MYNSFFGFDSDPFRVNPDPRFLYMSESHAEALATLIYAVQERKGFITLTGEVGTGKTTILNALLQKLGSTVQTAYIFNTSLTVEDLFAALFEELELPPVEPFRKTAALSRLNQHLIRRLSDGLQTLLIVDEAQNLSDEMLEEIRMLSNLETPQSKLLQIMLVGQPELAEKLSRPALRQLRQRVELRHAIRPLRAEETALYIRERLVVAGHPRGDVFAGPAEKAVHRYARGIPRVINVLCDNALIAAYARESGHVSAQMVESSASDLGLSLSPHEPHFVREGGSSEPRARTGWLRRLWRRGGAGARPEL
ncbi:MAG TPA: AAA family ATPase [Myxococcota bacterium]|nr:AAA family ATPase [Myxococcota bacterium]